MTNTQKTPEQVKKQYFKANKDYRVKILKKYGINNIDRIESVLAPKETVVKCTKAELAKVLTNHPVVTLTVSFQKPMKQQELYSELLTLHRFPGIIGNFEKVLKEITKEAISGVERKVTGFHNNKMDYTSGRLYMTETTVPLNRDGNSDNRMVLVTLSNINWIEVMGTKYVLK